MSPRRSLLAVGAILGSATLAGCSYNSPQTTATPYAASDGIVGTVNSVGLRNVMIVSAAKGKPGQMYGSLVNSGTTARKVTFTSETGSFPAVTVPAGAIIDLTSKSVKTPRMSVMPGERVNVTVATGGESAQVSVPVLDGTLPEYRTLVPSASGSAKASSSASKHSATPKQSASGKQSASATVRPTATPTSTATP